MHTSTTLSGTRQGFTLIEILLVIGLISVLAAIVIVAINPARQYAQGRDAARWSDANTILNAVHQYALDHDGNFPSTITTSSDEICKTGTATSTCTSAGLVNLSVVTDNETYLVSIPVDPSCKSGGGDCDANGTGYYIAFTSNGRIEVDAAEAEITKPIILTR